MFLLTFRRKYCIRVLKVSRESNSWSIKYIKILENFQEKVTLVNDHFNMHTRSQSTSESCEGALPHMHVPTCAHEHFSNSLRSGRKPASPAGPCPESSARRGWRVAVLLRRQKALHTLKPGGHAGHGLGRSGQR